MQPTEFATFAQQVFRKLDKRLLPLLISLYIVAYLDRVNIGFAKLTMAKQLSSVTASTDQERVFFLSSTLSD